MKYPTAPRLAGMALLATSLMFTGSMAMAGGPHHGGNGTLSISATGKVEVAPDKALMSAVLWEKTALIPADQADKRDPEAMRVARDKLEQRAAELIAGLDSMGIDSDNISAGPLTVFRERAYRQSSADNEEQALLYTRVQRPMVITLNDVDQVPAVIDALAKAGVDQLGGVRYTLQNTSEAEKEALQRAVAKARSEAQIIAEGLGEELDGVASVNKGNPRRPAPLPHARMMDSMASNAESGGTHSSQAEYRAGLITINAAVNVTWHLDD